jgi:DNA polymerase-3 subunit alpha
MAEFAKYSFNRAHAYAYAVISYWCAWLKVHYPVEFLAALLSTVDKDAIPALINETRRLGFKVLPPDINESGRGFTGADQTIRYGLDSVKGVGEAALEAITREQPYTSWEDFTERCSVNSGVVRLMARVGAFDALVPNRRGLETKLQGEAEGTSTQCVFKDPAVVGPNGLPCTFDWTTEPIQIGRSGKPLKAKPLPKKCTKACRGYTAPAPLDISTVEPYSARDIREIERQVLGTYLSSTPFDDLPEHIVENCLDADQLEMAPAGLHVIAATVTRIKLHRDRNDNVMAFISLLAKTGEVDLVAFSRTFAQYRNVLTEGLLCIAGVQKKQRNGEWSYSLVELVAPKLKD